MVKSHEKRSLAGTVVEVDDETFRALRHVDFEVLIEPFVSAEQTVFNARCEDDGIFWINVFGGVDKVRNDGEFSCVAETVGGDVVQPGFKIEQVNLFVVSRVG